MTKESSEGQDLPSVPQLAAEVRMQMPLCQLQAPGCCSIPTDPLNA